VSLEERRADLALQCGQLAAERWLRDAKLPCGPDDTLLFGRHHEVAESREMHGELLYGDGDAGSGHARTGMAWREKKHWTAIEGAMYGRPCRSLPRSPSAAT
jgi:hypothetical protein